MGTKATFAIKACSRCGKGISKGDEITRWDRQGQRSSWVHAGCEAPQTMEASGDEARVVTDGQTRMVVTIENRQSDSPGTTGWLQARARRIILSPITDLFTGGVSPPVAGSRMEDQIAAARVAITAEDVNPNLTGRCAWLADEHGHLVLLLVARIQGQSQQINRHYRQFAYELPGGIVLPWTDAAWKLLDQILQVAIQMMNEPAELAAAFKVEVGHRDPTVRYLAQAATEDLAARAALVDHLNGEADL